MAPRTRTEAGSRTSQSRLSIAFIVKPPGKPNRYAQMRLLPLNDDDVVFERTHSRNSHNHLVAADF